MQIRHSLRRQEDEGRKETRRTNGETMPHRITRCGCMREGGRRGTMFEKVLFPTDFSDVAEKALEFVKELKEAGTEEVIVLHVIKKQSLEVIAQYSSIREFQEVEQEVEGDARHQLQQIANDLRETGLAVTIRIETGFPVIEILKVETEEDVSAIVIGSHGLSNLKEILLGSVSESVIRKSKKPVVVIKRE